MIKASQFKYCDAMLDNLPGKERLPLLAKNNALPEPINANIGELFQDKMQAIHNHAKKRSYLIGC
ncbi:MAG: hypothetical protein ACJAXM_001749 [Arenicella sp.]